MRNNKSLWRDHIPIDGVIYNMIIHEALEFGAVVKYKPRSISDSHLYVCDGNTVLYVHINCIKRLCANEQGDCELDIIKYKNYTSLKELLGK